MLDIKRRTLPIKPRPEILEAIDAGQTLPIVDFGPYLTGVPGAKEQLAADIRAVQETLGFYCAINHGVPIELISQVEEQGRRLFHLPEEVKLRYKRDQHMQGYWPAITRDQTPRLGFEQEKVGTVGAESWSLHPDYSTDPDTCRRNRAPNKWPDSALLPEFAGIIGRYQRAMVKLGQKLVPIYALALQGPEDVWSADFQDPAWYQRMNFYAHVPGKVVSGAPPHSDHGFLTLLPMTSITGLQVRTPDGNWMDVGYVAGGIIINTGQWLNQISGGRFIATPHRVVQPTTERISMPVFFNPSDEALNHPVGQGGGRSFPESTFYDFFMAYTDRYAKPGANANG